MNARFVRPLVSAAENTTQSECASSAFRVAYIMSRFPRLTETFVLDEILELERNEVAVEVFPLWRENAKVVHP